MSKESNLNETSVATPQKNDALQHSVEGVTTRDDLHDAGVPMLPGDASEPQGPEDAFGIGPKRGDYTGRVRSGESYVSEAIPAKERTPGGPISRLVPQFPRAAEIGEVAGEKGGVTTS